MFRRQVPATIPTNRNRGGALGGKSPALINMLMNKKSSWRRKKRILCLSSPPNSISLLLILCTLFVLVALAAELYIYSTHHIHTSMSSGSGSILTSTSTNTSSGTSSITSTSSGMARGTGTSTDHINADTSDSPVETSKLKPAITPRIPHRIIIIDKANSIYDIASLPRRQNTFHTIYKYVTAWQQGDNPLSSSSTTTTTNTTHIHHSNNSNKSTTNNDHDKKAAANTNNQYDAFIPNIYESLVSSSSATQTKEKQTSTLLLTNSTIDQYTWFLNDKTCLQLIQSIEPQLIPYFQKEKVGQYKADMCRVMALYQKGGYYFDTDMQVIQPLHLSSEITFTSPWEAHEGRTEKVGIFNSFIAAAPHHPILNYTIQSMLKYYKKEIKLSTWMGTGTMYLAYQQFVTEQQQQQQQGNTHNNDWPLDMNLAETLLSNNPRYDTFPRHENGQGCCCDYVVHNNTSNVIYFYSRIVGAGDFCAEKKKKKKKGFIRML